MANSLRDARREIDRLRSMQLGLQQECENLRGQLRTAGATASEQPRANQPQPTDDRLRKELQTKQSEIDSWIKELDETRNKLYELTEQANEYHSRLNAKDAQSEQLRLKVCELESQAQKERSQRELQLDSARNEIKFKDAKLQAADKEAEQLRQEFQRLKAVEVELNNRFRQNNEKVQQMMTSREADAKVLEQKTEQELQLRKRLTEQKEQLRLTAEKYDQSIKVMNQKLKQAQQQLMQANEKVAQTQQQLQRENQRNAQVELELKQTNEKLADSENFVADRLSETDSLEASNNSLQQQLMDLDKKQDEATNLAAFYRHRFEEEQSRSASFDSELSRLMLDHSKLSAAYTEIEQNATRMLATEHEIKTQLQQTEQRLKMAEEANDILMGQLQVSQIENAKLRTERDALRVRVNGLAESLTHQQSDQQSSSANGLLDKHRTMPTGGGGNRN